MRTAVILALTALVLAGCGKVSPPAANAASQTNAAPSAPSYGAPTGAPANTAPVAAAAAAGQSYQVTVTLSSAAAGLLHSLGQDVIISADLYGMANAQGHHLQDDMGQVGLGNETRVTLPGAGTATVPVQSYDQSLLADIQDGQPQLLINVFSGEGLNPDNKLDCSLFQDKLSLALQSGIQIQCKLIGEGGAG